MTPRFLVFFVILFSVMVFGEWFQFFRGFDTHLWTFSNWIMLLFVLVAEAVAVGIITMTVDKALPAAGNRAPTKDAKQARRGSQKYSAR